MPIVKIKKCLNCDISHNWIFEGLTLRELRTIKKITGMSQAEFAKAGDDGDPESLAALLFILHGRDKIKVPFDDIDVDFNDFAMDLTEQEQKEYDEIEALEAAANKSGRNPKSQKASGTKNAGD